MFSDLSQVAMFRYGLTPDLLDPEANVIVIQTKFAEGLDAPQVAGPVIVGVMTSEIYLKRWDDETGEWTGDDCEVHCISIY